MDDVSPGRRSPHTGETPARPGDPGSSGGLSAANDDADDSAAAIRREDEGGSVSEPPAGSAVVPSDSSPEYKDRWLRAEAELQNFRRRASRDWEEGRRMAEESVLLEMVATLDDLDRALEAGRSPEGSDAWIEGVALVAQRLRDGLARRGVTVEDPLGRLFDPAFHEALLEVDAPADATPGTVVQVAHKGYRRGDRALRPARVVVARTPAGSSS